MRLRPFAAVAMGIIAAACIGNAPEVVGELHEASAAADGPTVWVVGGTVVSDAVWDQMTTPSVELPAEAREAVTTGASHHAVQYDLRGRVLQDVDLSDLALGPVPAPSGLTARSVAGGSVLAATACLPTSEASTESCNLTPVVLVITDGQIERMALDEEYTGAEDVRVVGAFDSEVLVAIAPQAGASMGSPDEVDLFAIDPGRSHARRIALPPGVRFARAVCIWRTQVVALTIALEETVGAAAGTLQVGVVDSSGSLDGPISLPVAAHFPGAAAIVCRGDRVTVLELPPPYGFSSDTDLVLHDVDLVTGTVTASSVLPLSYTSLPNMESIDGDLLLIAGADTSEARPVRWSGGFLGRPGPGFSGFGTEHVVIGDQLLDISGLLGVVPGEHAVAPVAVPIPALP